MFSIKRKLPHTRYFDHICEDIKPSHKPFKKKTSHKWQKEIKFVISSTNIILLLVQYQNKTVISNAKV